VLIRRLFNSESEDVACGEAQIGKPKLAASEWGRLAVQRAESRCAWLPRCSSARFIYIGKACCDGPLLWSTLPFALIAHPSSAERPIPAVALLIERRLQWSTSNVQRRELNGGFQGRTDARSCRAGESAARDPKATMELFQTGHSSR
jgi:hypothetical protein